MSGPSDKARAASEQAYGGSPLDRPDTVDPMLQAAHNPALGLDRSVCLRDVTERLREVSTHPVALEAADFLEREFGGSAGG